MGTVVNGHPYEISALAIRHFGLFMYFVSTHADRQGVDISFTDCVSCLFACSYGY